MVMSAGPSVDYGRVRIVRRNDGAEVSAEGMVYPVVRKGKGRPKSTDKTLNRVYTKQKTNAVVAHPNESVK